MTHNTYTYTRRLANVGTMLAHRLRRWPNTVPTLAERLLFDEIMLSDNIIRLVFLQQVISFLPSKHDTLTQCWVNVGPTYAGLSYVPEYTTLYLLGSMWR